jgi:hypothetical protein
MVPSTATPSPSAVPTRSLAPASPTPAADLGAAVVIDEFPAGAPHNEVRLEKQGRSSLQDSRVDQAAASDDRRRACELGFAQGGLHRLPHDRGRRADRPLPRGASTVRLESLTFGKNVGCARCIAVARAMRYAIPVDDLSKTPDQIESLIRDIALDSASSVGDGLGSAHDPPRDEPHSARAREAHGHRRG